MKRVRKIRLGSMQKALLSTVLLGSIIAPAAAQIQTHSLNGSKIDFQSVRQYELGDHVRIDQFTTPDGIVQLELDRVQILADDAQLIVGSEDGQSELARPQVIVLSGIVAGDPTSMAYLAISPYGINGFIDLNGELTSISTGQYAQEKDLADALRSARMAELIKPEEMRVDVCGYTPGDTALEPSGPAIEYVPQTDRGVATCRIAGIAIETDWEFTDRLFGGNTDASAAYVISLMGAISEIYERDVNVRLSIPFLRVWADNSDPYSLAGDPLDLVRSEWNSNMGDVERTLVHYLTGRTDTSYGGVAYLSVLCNESFGYGVSAYLNGSFPYPLADNNGGNWDVVVVSHELGHNFGTGHTHNYSPPIDNCGNGDCSSAFGGTIMSYCHSCSGGISNIVLQLHPRVQDVIIGYMDSIGCDLVGEGVSAVNDSAETIEDTVVTIDALGNDESESCDSFTLLSFDSSSANGGSVTLLAGQGPGGRDMFEYTPATGFGGLDTFDYTITGNGITPSATVTIDVRALRNADVRLNPIAGLSVDYYVLGDISLLPDFDLLKPYADDITDHVAYETSSGAFMSSGRVDRVGAVIEGYVWAFLDGVYTFTTDSDDGSRLWIGDELIVNNDGLHGMVKRGGTIPLRAGWHQLRIEFFENAGNAGLISTVAGPGLVEQNLQGFILSHESSAQCSEADLNADGVVNFFDVSEFLNAFNNQEALADFTNDGEWNFFDVSAFLQAFNEGCP